MTLGTTEAWGCVKGQCLQIRGGLGQPRGWLATTLALSWGKTPLGWAPGERGRFMYPV